ncbi:MAG: hypothetical protein RLY71_3015 [Pseudomonadota bacterium]
MRHYHLVMIASNPSQMATTSMPPAELAPDSATHVLRLFRVVFNTVKTHFQQVEKQAGVGGAQVWALSVIRDRPGIGVNALAGAMDIHQSTASNLVKSLVDRGMIEVARTGQDRRAVQLHLLDPGLEVLKTVPGPFAGVLPQALASLDDVTLERLRGDLEKLIAALDADKQAAQIPLGQL